MNKEIFKQVFKPDWRRGVIFVIFTFIAFGGYAPPFPFGIILGFLALPLILLLNLITAISGYNMEYALAGPLRLLIYLIYFYTLSCLIIFVLDKFRRKK